MSTHSESESTCFDDTTLSTVTPEKLHEKFFDLCWYARRNREQVEQYNEPFRTQALEKMMEIEEQYPIEIKELRHDIMGEFFQGFNSGMLACLRLLSDAKIYQTHWEDFPYLDT